MKDNLENIIRENRGSFDSRDPGNLWENISRRLPEKQGKWNWIWKAAAIAFFLSTSYLLISDFAETEQPVKMASKEATAEFPKVEDFYFQQIDEKRILIDELQQDGNSDIRVIEELIKLDAMYLVLREQYEQNPTEEVIDALTLNLLVRVDLLNQTIAQLDQPIEI